jgi:hypothetical protein
MYCDIYSFFQGDVLWISKPWLIMFMKT